ncbi:MAG: SdrD B-like domain-containing protein [Tepidisphaeraceae bacterium]
MTHNHAQPLFETLETRRLMAAITVNGTPGNDVIHVDLVSAGDTLTINGMGGADVVKIGAAGHTVQNVVGDVVIKNPTGTMSVAADDGSDASARHAFLSATGITGLAPGKISFDAGTHLTITGGSNNDTFTIGSTGAGMHVAGGFGVDRYEINQHHSSELLTLHDRDGSNEYRIAESTGNLDNVTGPISIGDGGGGSVSIFDWGAAVGHTYWLTKFSPGGSVNSAKLARSGPTAEIELNDVGRVWLTTSQHDDVVYMSGTTAQFPAFQLNTIDGNDTVFANNGAPDSLMGGNGIDTVTVDYLDAVGEFETVKAAATDGSIFGSVFADKNGNGVQDVGDGGLASVQVYLDADNDKVWDSQEAGDLTDANGNWSFIGVPTGKQYIARTMLKAGLAQTTPSNGSGIHVTLSPGQTVTGKKFGVKEVSVGSSISGTVFNDVDGNGVKGVSEGVFAGRTVYIDLDNDKVLDANEKSTKTDGAGFYMLTGLAAGTYKVRQIVPAGWTQTTPANGSGISVTLLPNLGVGGKLFGVRQTPAATASIAGKVFNDTDGDGTKDAGEGSLSGRTVWVDLDLDKVIDAGEPKTTTDGSGNYKFSGLSAGTYKVRQQLPAGWAQTTPVNGYGIGVTLATGQAVTGKYFGAAPTTASIAGKVFNDLDGDGTKDAGEGSLSGRTVWLDLDLDKVIDANEPKTTTDASGNYKFASLVSGTYKVRQQLPAGWAQTTPTGGYGIGVTLTTGQAVTGQLFGERKIV